MGPFSVVLVVVGTFLCHCGNPRTHVLPTRECSFYHSATLGNLVPPHCQLLHCATSSISAPCYLFHQWNTEYVDWLLCDSTFIFFHHGYLVTIATVALITLHSPCGCICSSCRFKSLYMDWTWSLVRDPTRFGFHLFLGKCSTSMIFYQYVLIVFKVKRWIPENKSIF